MSITFTVHGRPQQRGSKVALPNKKGGRPLMVDANKNSKPWMAAVAAAAGEAMNGAALLEGPLKIRVRFRFKRPKAHYRKQKGVTVLRDGVPTYHAKAPDADKLCRSIGDALSGVVYRDDSQLASVDIVKEYTESSEGAVIEVSQLRD